MKNLLIFLFGACIGAGGTILWLRKDIQKQLEDIKKEEQKYEDMPFTIDKEEEEPVENIVKKPEKVAYYQIPQTEKKTEEEPAEENNDLNLIGEDETDGGFFEIDVDEMMHNHEYEKERLVYYRGDKIMATEAGTIIANPFILVGGEWEQCVGNYAENTAFIRNPRLATDYEIYVEDGLYSDEYGTFDD